MGDGFEAFEINEFDLEQAYNPLNKRRRFTKHQQTYGVWADEEDESGSDGDSGAAHFKRGKKSTKSKDYTTPVNFVSGGVKQGDKIKPPVVELDEEDDDVIQITGFKKTNKFSAQKSSKGAKNTTIRNEMFAGIRGAGPSTGENYADWEKYTKGIGSKLLYKVFFYETESFRRLFVSFTFVDGTQTRYRART